MGARSKIRLHYRDGRVVIEPLHRTAAANGTDLPGARQMIADWVAAGDLVERPDGGYDVVRFRPRRRS